MNGRQRQRRRGGLSALSSVGTNALIAYGTYKVASWAWKSWYDHHNNSVQNGENGEQQQQQQQQQEQQPRSWLEGITSSTLSPDHNNSTRSTALTHLQLKKCHDETWSTFASFLLPTLETKLEEATKLSTLTRSLKKLRKRRRTLKATPETEGLLNSTLDTNDTNANINNELSGSGSGDGSNGDRSRRRRNREEADIWKKLQGKTITRMVSTVYAHAFLYLVLWVQVRILGGRLHLQQQRRRKQEDETVADADGNDEFDSHRMVLTQTFRTFFRDGVPKIVKAVEAIVEAQLQDWNVIVEEGKEEEKKGDDAATAKSTTTLGCISAKDLGDVVRRIRSSFETEIMNVPVEGDGAQLCPFLISLFVTATADTAIAEKNTSADTAGHILNETWDLLESPVWKEVERDCLDASFDTLRDGSYNTNAPMEEGTAGRNMGWSKLFTPKSQAGHSSWNGGGDNGPQGVGDDGGVEEAVPLAYVLTQLKKVTQTSFYTQVSTRDAFRGGVRAGVHSQGDMMKTTSCPNVYVQVIERLPSLEELSDACFNSYY